MRYAPLLALFTLLLSACDSDTGEDTRTVDVDGLYEVQSWFFDPSAAFFPDANVADTLDLNRTQLTLAGQNRTFSFSFRREGDRAQSLLNGSFEVDRSDRVTINFGEDEAQRSRLLLPPTVRFTFNEAEGTLTTSTQLSNVDLEAYDPVTYRDTPPVGGTLTIVLVRL
jgi:hypothetical protein